MTAGNDKALVIFSRLPIGHETKTRLSPILNDRQREGLHVAMWHDIFGEAVKLNDTDIYLCWTGSGDVKDCMRLIPSSFCLMKQEGDNLGERMRNAMREIFALGYVRAVIIGSDIPSVKSEDISASFGLLDEADVVIGSSCDGGYWLIGMRRYEPGVFSISSWGGLSVLEESIRAFKELGLTYAVTSTLHDLDTPEDVRDFMSSEDNISTCTYRYLRGIKIPPHRNGKGASVSDVTS